MHGTYMKVGYVSLSSGISWHKGTHIIIWIFTNSLSVITIGTVHTLVHYFMMPYNANSCQVMIKFGIIDPVRKYNSVF